MCDYYVAMSYKHATNSYILQNIKPTSGGKCNMIYDHHVNKTHWLSRDNQCDSEQPTKIKTISVKTSDNKYLGPVVHNFVSLTSLLRPQFVKYMPT